MSIQRRLAKVLGFNVDLFGFQEAVSYVEEKLKANEHTHVITINPEMIDIASENQFLKLIFDRAELVIPDGVGIKIALGFQGIEQEVIPGIEFSKALISLAAQKGYKVAFIGAKQEVLEKAMSNLKNEFPALNVCYTQNGYFSKIEEKNIIENIKNSAPDMVFVALGAPKQEVFIAECIDAMQHSLKKSAFVGVGGSFDVWSGEVQRAPESYRNLGLEWLYRLLSDPSRFTRIFPALPIFLIKSLFYKGTK